MSNKLRSFLIVVISIAVVMVALPMNAFRVNADGEYTITYHPYGDNLTTKQVTYDVSTQAPSPNILGDYDVYGYKFVKWCVDSSGEGTSYTTNDELPQQNIELYGVWEFDSDNYVKVTLDCGGTYGEAETLLMPKNGSAVIAVPASWNIPNNIVFSHWSVEGSNVEISDTVLYTFASDTTLKANWKQVYIITYYPNSALISDKPFTDTCVFGSTTYVVKDNPYTYEGYKFDGWCSSAGGSTGSTTYQPGAIINNVHGDFPLHAWWVREITFHANNGIDPEATDKQTIPVLSTAALKTPSFSNSGKTLIGWSTQDDFTTIKYVNGESVKITGDNSKDVDVDLYAQWGDTCKITFDPNYPDGVTGTGTMNPLFAGKGFTTNLNNVYSVTGYTLKGWTTEKTASDVTYNATSISLDENLAENEITLYAQWEINKYTITFMSDGTEISADTYNHGQTPVAPSPEPTKTPTNTEVYSFVGWADSTGTLLDSLPAATGNATYYARFTSSTRYYSVSATANPSAGGTVSGSGSSYEWNSTATVVASPSTGYHFVNWTDESGTEVNTSSSFSFEVDGARNLTANFAINSYSVNATAGEHGSVSGSGTYKHFETCDLVATPDTGYHFVSWTDENETVVSTSASYSFDVVAARNLTANFAINSYSVDATAGEHGSVTGAESGTYKHFETCDLVATPDTGYHFVNWTDESGTVVSTSASFSFKVEDVRSLTANFEINSYAVNATAGEYGSVSGVGTYEHFSKATVIAIPNTGYHFINWTDENGTEVSKNASYSFEVVAARNLTANFEVNSYYVDATAGEHGSVTGADTYKHFSNATVTATPDTGYHFVNWTDENGTEVSKNASYVFEVEGVRSLTANFAVNSYSVDATAGEHGSVSGSGTYDHFETCTLVAMPDKGYHFAGWEENGTTVSDNANYRFSVTGGRKLKAVFEINMYTVTYKNDDGTILQEGEFPWGSTASYQHMANPTKKPTAQFTYTFAGWDNKETLVTKDITYTATYTYTVNKYKITFANEDGTVLQTGEIEYGKFPVYEKDTPTKAATVQETFTFAGWDKEISKVTGETVYTATYTSKPITKDSINYKYFTVAFVTNGGSEIVSQLVAEGGVAFRPEEPLRERYTFEGWYIDDALTKPFSFATVITSDITLYAKWIKGSPDIQATYAVIGLGSTTVDLSSVEDITVAVERSQDNDSIATHFKGVMIDGVEVDYYNYELTEDNSAVIIRADAFEGLEAGNHTIMIVYDDGTAEVELIVNDANEPTDPVEEVTETEAAAAAPEPAQITVEKASNLGLWIALGIVAAVVIAAIPIFIIKGRSLK